MVSSNPQAFLKPSFLDTSLLQELYPSTGRTPVPYEALLRALIYKGLRTSLYLSDLVRELRDNLNQTSRNFYNLLK